MIWQFIILFDSKIFFESKPPLYFTVIHDMKKFQKILTFFYKNILYDNKSLIWQNHYIWKKIINLFDRNLLNDSKSLIYLTKIFYITVSNFFIWRDYIMWKLLFSWFEKNIWCNSKFLINLTGIYDVTVTHAYLIEIYNVTVNR